MRNTANYLKTAILFAALTGLLISIGYIVAGRSGAIIFFLISLIINLVSYWFSDSIALSMSGAKPLSESEAPDLYSIVKELTQKMDLPMPRIYSSNEMQPNAFATGRNKNHAAICVTSGLLQVLNMQEIRGVLAHELSHVKNNDVLISTIAAVIAGAISSIANIAIFFGGGQDDNNRNSNPIAGILLLILAPVSAMLIQLAISRSREYAADATGAEYTKRPQDLANALIKIENVANNVPMNVNPSISSLYIQNPLRTDGIKELFSTHPKTENRVAKLIQMENEFSH